MDDFNRDQLSTNNDKVVRGNNDHLHYASDLKECNDVLKAGGLGKRRKAAGLFSTKSDSKLLTAMGAGKTVTILTSVTAATAGGAMVVAGTVAVAESLSPQYEISCVYNASDETKVDYVINIQNVEDFNTANITYTVDFTDWSNNKYSLKAATAIPSDQTFGSLNMAGYDNGNIYFSIFDKDGNEVKNYNFTYRAPLGPTYAISLSAASGNLIYGITIANVTDFSIYTYKVFYIDSIGELEIIPSTQITKTTTDGTYDITNFNDGDFRLDVYEGISVVASKTLTYVAPRYPTYSINLSFTGALNNTLRYVINIGNVTDFTGYTYQISYMASSTSLKTPLTNGNITSALTDATYDASAVNAGILCVDLLLDGAIVETQQINFVPTYAPTYDVTFALSDTTLTCSFNIQNVTNFTGYTYSVIYTDPVSGVVTDVANGPITAGDMVEQIDLSAFGDGLVTVIIYDNGTLVDNFDYNYVAPIPITYSIVFDLQGSDLYFTINTTGINDYTGYYYTLYFTEGSSPTDEILTQNLTTTSQSHHYAFTNYGAGVATIKIYNNLISSSALYSDSYNYVPPVVASFNTAFSVTDQTLTITVTSAGISNYGDYTISATYEDDPVSGSGNTYYLFNNIQLIPDFTRNIDMSTWGVKGEIIVFVYKTGEGAPVYTSDAYQYEYVPPAPTYDLTLQQYNDQLFYSVELHNVDWNDYDDYSYKVLDDSSASLSPIPPTVLAQEAAMTSYQASAYIYDMPGPNTAYTHTYYLEVYHLGAIVAQTTLDYVAPHFECDFDLDNSDATLAYNISYTNVHAPEDAGYYLYRAYGIEPDTTRHNFVGDHTLANGGLSALGTDLSSFPELVFHVEIVRASDSSVVASFTYNYVNPLLPTYNLNFTQIASTNTLSMDITIGNVTDFSAAGLTFNLYFYDNMSPIPDWYPVTEFGGDRNITAAHTQTTLDINASTYPNGTQFMLVVDQNGARKANETLQFVDNTPAPDPSFTIWDFEYTNAYGLKYNLSGQNFDPQVNNDYYFYVTYQSVMGAYETMVLGNTDIDNTDMINTLDIGEHGAGIFRLYIFNSQGNINGDDVAAATYNYEANPEVRIVASVHNGMDYRGIDIALTFFNLDNPTDVSNYEIYFEKYAGVSGAKCPNPISLVGYANTYIEQTVNNNQLTDGTIYYIGVRNSNTQVSIGVITLTYTLN